MAGNIPMKRDETAPKPSIDQQIAEVKRELALRKNVYEKRVQNRQMKLPEAELHTSRMEAVLATLEYMRDNREVIIAAVKASRA
jgi:hypothetical protein